MSKEQVKATGSWHDLENDCCPWFFNKQMIVLAHFDLKIETVIQ